MSLHGTWADHILIQAVANAMNLNIHIVESDNRFLATTVVESNSARNPRTVFLEHISETHYVSTCPALLDNTTETSLNTKKNNSEYMKNYRAKRTSAEDKAKRNEYNKKSRAAKTLPEDKARRNEYMKEYRAKKSKCDNDIEKSISLFHEIISKGPMHICTCCDQLWYKHSVKHVNKLRKSNLILKSTFAI